MHGIVIRGAASACVAIACALAWPVATSAQATESRQGEAVAVGTGPLTAAIIVETLDVQTSDAGTQARRFLPADRIRAGDEVHYTIRVTNPGREPVRDIIVTKRLPFGMHYVGGSAVGPACAVAFSIDGGESFSAAGDLEIGPAGARRKAGPGDYTHVRWMLKRPLPAGATALLRFRATLS